MPYQTKELLQEERIGWTGGLNTSVHPDLLQANEVVWAKNCRFGSSYGALTKRTGSKRLHSTALNSAASIQGCAQWDSPTGLEDVCVAGGDFYYRQLSDGEYSNTFAQVALAGVGSTAPAFFVPFRDASADAALLLYIACDGKLFSWDGTTMTARTGTSNAPQADRLIAYHTRLFARDQRYQKNAIWSYIADGTDWTVDASDITSGGSDLIDLLSGEAINAMGVVGSSLVFGTQDSLVRFTGYASDDIRVAQDTEGISATHGAAGPFCLTAVEDWLATFCSQGLYQVTEGGVTPLSTKIETTLRALDRSALSGSVIGYHRGRRELWLAVQASGDTGNQTVYVLDLALSAWAGPWTYPFAITSFARHQDANGDEYVVAGCSDGYLRHMDTGYQDDVHSDGSSGSDIGMYIYLPPIYFGRKTGLKALVRAMVRLETGSIGVSNNLLIYADWDPADNSYNTSASCAGFSSTVAGMRRVDLPESQGVRLMAAIVDAAYNGPTTVYGITFYAYDLKRMQSSG